MRTKHRAAARHAGRASIFHVACLIVGLLALADPRPLAAGTFAHDTTAEYFTSPSDQGTNNWWYLTKDPATGDYTEMSWYDSHPVIAGNGACWGGGTDAVNGNSAVSNGASYMRCGQERWRTVRKWMSTYADGASVAISWTAPSWINTGGDGIRMYVLKNGTRLWTETVANQADTTAHGVSTTVNFGDALYFEIDDGGGAGANPWLQDEIRWPIVVTVNGELHTPAFPYATGFEAPDFAAGDLHAQDGWLVRRGAAAIQASTVRQGAQAVEIQPYGKVDFPTNGLGGRVTWVESYCQATPREEAPDLSLMRAGSSVLYFDATGGITGLDGDGASSGTWVATGIMADSWTRIAIRQDYGAQTWNLYVNGTLQASNLGFKDNTITALSGFQCQPGSAGVMRLDDFNTSSSAPSPFTNTAPADASVYVEPAAPATLEWSASLSAVDYDVYLEQGNPSPTTLVEPSVTGNQWTVAGVALTPGSWYWRVVAKNATDSFQGATWSFVIQSAQPSSAQLRDHLLGRTPLTGARLQAADINGDGAVDMADVITSIKQGN